MMIPRVASQKLWLNNSQTQQQGLAKLRNKITVVDATNAPEKWLRNH